LTCFIQKVLPEFPVFYSNLSPFQVLTGVYGEGGPFFGLGISRRVAEPLVKHAVSELHLGPAIRFQGFPASQALSPPYSNAPQRRRGWNRLHSEPQRLAFEFGLSVAVSARWGPPELGLLAAIPSRRQCVPSCLNSRETGLRKSTRPTPLRERGTQCDHSTLKANTENGAVMAPESAPLPAAATQAKPLGASSRLPPGGAIGPTHVLKCTASFWLPSRDIEHREKQHPC